MTIKHTNLYVLYIYRYMLYTCKIILYYFTFYQIFDVLYTYKM